MDGISRQKWPSIQSKPPGLSSLRAATRERSGRRSEKQSQHEKGEIYTAGRFQRAEFWVYTWSSCLFLWVRVARTPREHRARSKVANQNHYHMSYTRHRPRKVSVSSVFSSGRANMRVYPTTSRCAQPCRPVFFVWFFGCRHWLL